MTTSTQRARQPTSGWHALASTGGGLRPRAGGLGEARVDAVLGGVRWRHDDGGVDKRRKGKLVVITGVGVDYGGNRLGVLDGDWLRRR
jgi:hypothetical protein